MGYALSDAGDYGRATSVPSRRHSEKLRNRDDDFLRQSPASSPAADTSDGGMLDAFDSQFAADPNADWLNQNIKFGSGPASPTIAKEEAEQRRQHDATPYLDGGNTVPAQLTQNFPLTLWRQANRNPALTSLPAAFKDEDPDDQLAYIKDYGAQLKNMVPPEAPRGFTPSGDGNDRGMLDDFDAEFDSGAPLDDANLDKRDLRELEERRFGGKTPFSAMRESSYMKYKGEFAELWPTAAPMAEALESTRKKVNKRMRYAHDGAALRSNDPRTRGTGQDPIPKRTGLMSRIGTGISKWWRGSKLNWANWGGSGGQRAG